MTDDGQGEPSERTIRSGRRGYGRIEYGRRGYARREYARRGYARREERTLQIQVSKARPSNITQSKATQSKTGPIKYGRAQKRSAPETTSEAPCGIALALTYSKM
jgi:hypothetical protein